MIIPLEQQVAPLALCQRLKQLGAPQDSEFAWIGYDSPTSVSFPLPMGRSSLIHDDPPILCAAYTVAELGAMLPGIIDEKFNFQTGKDGGNGWWVRYMDEDYSAGEDPREHRVFRADPYPAGQTEAEARARLLISLVERGVVTFEKAAT